MGPAPLRPWHPAALLGTFFGVGRLPFAPGSCGSLAALGVAWFLRGCLGRNGFALACALLFAAGWWASARIVKATEEKDPQRIVVDEAAAQWLVLLPLPQSLPAYALGFLLFRLFDITKPPPARWVEETIEGGLGVMLDDLVAAGYALALYFLLFAIGKASGVFF
jgi:phosphatidylglycerophosphatase A